MRSTLPAFNEVWQRQFRSGVLKQIQCFPPESTFLIGCSGGMDSMLLLHLMSDLVPEKIRTIYVDHQLQSISADWGRFVSDQCAALNVPCIVEAVEVQDGNLEHQARNARYQAYSKHLKSNEILVLAHHQQDQAETLMLRLLSGAGVHGLAAMKQVDVREQFTIWRPLLDISREQICQWATQLGVQNIEDPTNLDTHYDRAWCRHELWPLLQKRYPKMQQALSRTSYLMQDAEDILLDVLQQDLKHCGSATELDLKKLAELSSARQRQLLSAWMKEQDTYRPSFEMVQRLLHEVIESKSDAQAALHWNQYYYVRYQQKLFRLSTTEYLAEKNQSIANKQTILLQLGQKVETLSGDYLAETAKVGLSTALLGQKLDLVMRQGGEKIHLYGRVGAWPLKKAIQEAQIFPWQRYRIQILSIDNVMLGVFTPKGFWLAQSEYCEIGGWQPNLIS
ncbi:tRNA lysidine(34) synthetase TilS [Acinetobacter sp. C_4_1]|uniref:tRNA lysidine(34) synthetase TilS n=1 Tax=unclassified Acinetobacter TaxID=196816 RepID=UPI0021B7F52F|nr:MULTISPECIES: tRNA lysidine(34) synthetase TilS [unclassified Acinetobacter]MCT8090641.1 tRNA lysidine(34) synthetase TilS [Acinetobacter sp. F_3_1]MCT8099119.1 tRNA lysidine(34) synthetase TilS [Acinetobacter sp. C_3_1]MCT8102192.1 tRNA lysidine(34) synthetase TilS [Acinetobacter sp. C_4_1]MCT8135939.1 tRNA lysidine(34) synthetase TilS [Acinetobacter sp. T_3_1]